MEITSKQQDLIRKLPVSKILDRARSIGEVSVIYLFGSYLLDRMTPESDLDLAILFNKKPDPLEVLDLQEDLCGITGYEVDLVILNDVAPVLGMQVVRHGIPLVTINSTESAKFVMVTISKYHDFKRIIQPLADAMIEEARHD